MEIIRVWILMAFLSTAISSGLGAPFLLNHVALAASATNSSSSEHTGISWLSQLLRLIQPLETHIQLIRDLIVIAVLAE